MHNGIDTDLYRPDHGTDVLDRLGLDPDAPVRRCSSAGSPARRACRTCCARRRDFDPAAQLVLCAGAPDTPEIDRRVPRPLSTSCARERDGRALDPEMLPRPEVVQLLTHAAVFVCPSVYEPLGIVNLEAMACETAVVASRRRRHPRGRRRRRDGPPGAR